MVWLQLPSSPSTKTNVPRGVIRPKSTSAVLGEYVQLIVTVSSASIERDVPMVAVVFGSVVTSTLFVALCVVVNADTGTLNARKAENSNSQSLLLLLPAYPLP